MADSTSATSPQAGLNGCYDAKYDQQDFPVVSFVNQPGHPGHTTPEQDAAVCQLRMMLEADGYTERLDSLTLVSGEFENDGAGCIGLDQCACKP